MTCLWWNLLPAVWIAAWLVIVGEVCFGLVSGTWRRAMRPVRGALLWLMRAALIGLAMLGAAVRALPARLRAVRGWRRARLFAAVRDPGDARLRDIYRRIDHELGITDEDVATALEPKRPAWPDPYEPLVFDPRDRPLPPMGHGGSCGTRPTPPVQRRDG